MAGCTAPSTPVAVGEPSVSAPHVTASATASPSASSGPATVTPKPSSTAAAPALHLSSVVNFRDVAGSGLSLPGGAHMATGVVYRSAQPFTASRADLARLARAGITLVIDLRTNGVAAAAPDPAIAGAHHVLVNIFGSSGGTSGHHASVASARAAMRRMNVEFVTDAGQRARIARVLTLIADAKAPVLIHCQAGKDRTGWISAVLQLTAGASRAQVVDEYLKSNEYRATLMADAYRHTLAAKGATAAKIQRALQLVDASYLGAGLSELTGRYGNLDGYLTKGLGLSKATIERLRARLTA